MVVMNPELYESLVYRSSKHVLPTPDKTTGRKRTSKNQNTKEPHPDPNKQKTVLPLSPTTSTFTLESHESLRRMVDIILGCVLSAPSAQTKKTCQNYIEGGI
jgi:hypothetical protein